MATSDELVTKLENWIEERETEPTFFEVVELGETEMVAGYVLKKFRDAARKATIDGIQTWFDKYPSPGLAGTSRLLQAFDLLSARWDLSPTEKLSLLGFDDAENQRRLREVTLEELPIDVIERIAILLSIASILRSLSPVRSSAHGWVKRANRAPLFSGQTALDYMIENGAEGMRKVHSHLLSQLWGH